MAVSTFENVNADTTFKRSTWEAHPRWTSDMRHGYLYPVKIIEILPSDSISGNLRMYTRMNQPIAPIFGDITQHFAAFFCPKRIIWNKTKQFYGEAPSFGVASEISEPTLSGTNSFLLRSDVNSPDVWCTFGSAFGLVSNAESYPDDSDDYIPINKLPIWAYGAIYNEYFRNENYQPKFMWDKDEFGDSTTQFMRLGTSYIKADSSLIQVNKDTDIFTSILPYALKSTENITLPITGSLPVITGDEFDVEGNDPVKFIDVGNGNIPEKNPLYLESNGHLDVGAFVDINGDYISHDDVVGTGQGIAPTNLYADASKAINASLTDLINSLSYQYYLTKLAKGGSKYGEYLEVMFGSKCPAATRDEPEFLGHFSQRLNIDTVVQTTGYDSSSASELGAVGGNSQTAGKGVFFRSSFTEPGYLVILTYIKHKRSYSTSINPIFLKKDLLDYYQTPFANAPDVSMDSELMYFDGDNTKRKPLGFVEPYLENKVFADEVFGGMNPQNPNSFDFWTLADKYDEQPTINGEWLKEDRLSISRALVSGESGSDYICDVFVDLTLSRVMPLHSKGMGVL